MDSLTVTEAAATQIKAIMDLNAEAAGLRIAIAGGGCSGFKYDFELPTADDIEDDDNVYETHGVKVVIDPISLEYLKGSELEWKQELMGARFVLNNPNQVGSCGCGESVMF